MKYSKKEAKDYARAHLKGIWAAALIHGQVRPPMLELTEAEKEATRKAIETCGLKVPGAAHKSSAA